MVSVSAALLRGRISAILTAIAVLISVLSASVLRGNKIFPRRRIHAGGEHINVSLVLSLLIRPAIDADPSLYDKDGSLAGVLLKPLCRLIPALDIDKIGTGIGISLVVARGVLGHLTLYGQNKIRDAAFADG